MSKILNHPFKKQNQININIKTQNTWQGQKWIYRSRLQNIQTKKDSNK